jgi:hypothetical protein
MMITVAVEKMMKKGWSILYLQHDQCYTVSIIGLRRKNMGPAEKDECASDCLQAPT